MAFVCSVNFSTDNSLKFQVIKTVKTKIGMRSDAECFAIYEIMGSAGW